MPEHCPHDADSGMCRPGQPVGPAIGLAAIGFTRDCVNRTVRTCVDLAGDR
jgi:hypothetical protein